MTIPTEANALSLDTLPVDLQKHVLSFVPMEDKTDVVALNRTWQKTTIDSVLEEVVNESYQNFTEIAEKIKTSSFKQTVDPKGIINNLPDEAVSSDITRSITSQVTSAVNEYSRELMCPDILSSNQNFRTRQDFQRFVSQFSVNTLQDALEVKAKVSELLDNSIEISLDNISQPFLRGVAAMNIARICSENEQPGIASRLYDKVYSLVASCFRAFTHYANVVYSYIYSLGSGGGLGGLPKKIEQILPKFLQRGGPHQWSFGCKKSTVLLLIGLFCAAVGVTAVGVIKGSAIITAVGVIGAAVVGWKIVACLKERRMLSAVFT